MRHVTRYMYIRKKTLPEWLTYYIFLFPFLSATALEFLHLPGILKYTVDIAWILVLFFLVFTKRMSLYKRVMPFLMLVAIWFLVCFTVYLFKYQSVFYFLWGIRNNMRLYVAFLAFITFFDEEDASICIKFLDILFYVNVGVTLIQFFLLGYNQDYLGGIFGAGRGCNGYTILFFVLVVGKSMIMYMEGHEPILSFILKSGLSLIIAAMAELKFYIVFFVCVVVIASILTKFSWKKIQVLLFSAVLLFFSGSILIAIFGAKEELTIQRIWALATAENYATAEDLGRFTAIPKISKTILTEWPDRLFGMGIGNCDTSAFAICNTPFYQTHEQLHYSWFSSAFLYLETGIIGLILNIAFFVLSLVSALSVKRQKASNDLFCNIAIIVSIVCIILTFYNATLRKEIGYVAYFALALPHISLRSTTVTK